MKSALFLALIGSAAAFAPAPQSKVCFLIITSIMFLCCSFSIRLISHISSCVVATGKHFSRCRCPWRYARKHFAHQELRPVWFGQRWKWRNFPMVPGCWVEERPNRNGCYRWIPRPGFRKYVCLHSFWNVRFWIRHSFIAACLPALEWLPAFPFQH